MEWRDKQRRARLKDLRSEKDISQERPDDYQLMKTDRMNGEEVSWTFHLSSKKLVKFFKKREMSDEDREMARQRMMDNVHSIRIEPKTTKNEKEKES